MRSTREPVEIGPAPRAALSADAPEDERAFAHGIAVGFALAAVAVHLVLVIFAGDWGAVYKDMGSQTLPLLTRVALSPAWQYGVPLVGGVVIGTLILRRPKLLAIYVAVALALGAATFITWWYPTAPLRELAGNIKD